MFVPQCEGGWIVEADYKQIELRAIAALAGDKPLLDMFASGADPHDRNARDLFGIPDSRQVSERERTLAKNFVYNVNYGGDANSIHPVLAVDTPIELTLVERMIERWYAKHPAIKRWQDKARVLAKERGYVEEPTSGRRRHFWGRIKATEVYNFPVQTLAGWVINKAIKNVAKELKWGVEGIDFQAHDALIVDGPDPLRLAEVLLAGMEIEVPVGDQKISFPCDLKLGRSWGTCQKAKLADIMKFPKGRERLVA